MYSLMYCAVGVERANYETGHTQTRMIVEELCSEKSLLSFLGLLMMIVNKK